MTHLNPDDGREGGRRPGNARALAIRQREMTKAMKAIQAAGREVSRVIIDVDGKIILNVVGQGEAPAEPEHIEDLVG